MRRDVFASCRMRQQRHVQCPWSVRTAKSLAAFGCSRSFIGVGGQNPNTKSQAVVAQVQVPERYVARAELAAIMGVSLATVDRMVAEGMPSVTWGRRTRR